MKTAALGALALAACTEGAKPQALGSIEVTARLLEIRGQFPANKLYDYVYVMKYQVLRVHRGSVPGDEIFVGHYNPLKPRPTAKDKFVKNVTGSLERFSAGDVHRMALEAPLEERYMGGIIDKYFGEPGTRYWAVATDPARE